MKTNDDVVLLDISNDVAKLIAFIYVFYKQEKKFDQIVNKQLILTAIQTFITEGMYTFHLGNQPLINLEQFIRNEFSSREFVRKFSDVIKQDQSLMTKYIKPKDLLQPDQKAELSRIPNPVIYDAMFNTSLGIMLMTMMELDRNKLLGNNIFYQVVNINERMLILRRMKHD